MRDSAISCHQDLAHPTLSCVASRGRSCPGYFALVGDAQLLRGCATCRAAAIGHLRRTFASQSVDQKAQASIFRGKTREYLLTEAHPKNGGGRRRPGSHRQSRAPAFYLGHKPAGILRASRFEKLARVFHY